MPSVFEPTILILASAGGRLIGSLGYILAVWGRRTGPRNEEMAGRSRGTDSQDLATILDPFRIIFDDLGPNLLKSHQNPSAQALLGVEEHPETSRQIPKHEDFD